MAPEPAVSVKSLCVAAALSTAPSNVMLPPAELTVVAPFKITGECNATLPPAEAIVVEAWISCFAVMSMLPTPVDRTTPLTIRSEPDGATLLLARMIFPAATI